MSKPIAEMHHAYVWDCDNCGRENFVRAIAFEGSPDDLEEMREEHGVETWDAGEFETYPDGVKCKHCGTEYATIPEEPRDE